MKVLRSGDLISILVANEKWRRTCQLHLISLKFISDNWQQGPIYYSQWLGECYHILARPQHRILRLVCRIGTYNSLIFACNPLPQNKWCQPNNFLFCFSISEFLIPQKVVQSFQLNDKISTKLYAKIFKFMYIRVCQKFGIKVYSRLQADSGQLQFWSEPSEILKIRSSNTPQSVNFNIPWYLEI